VVASPGSPTLAPACPGAHRRPVLVQMFPCATDCQLQLRHAHAPVHCFFWTQQGSPRILHLPTYKPYTRYMLCAIRIQSLSPCRLSHDLFCSECFLRLMILDPYTHSSCSTSNCCRQLHSSSSYRFDIVCASSTRLRARLHNTCIRCRATGQVPPRKPLDKSKRRDPTVRAELRDDTTWPTIDGAASIANPQPLLLEHSRAIRSQYSPIASKLARATVATTDIELLLLGWRPSSQASTRV
jgi:hypothetical protein